MKSFKREVKDFINYFGVRKEYRLDIQLQEVIANNTGFKPRDIEIQVASKVDIKEINKFDYFEFIYHKRYYKLIRGKLEEIKGV